MAETTTPIHVAQSDDYVAEVYVEHSGERTIYRVVIHGRADPVRSAGWPSVTRRTKHAAIITAERVARHGLSAL